MKCAIHVTESASVGECVLLSDIYEAVSNFNVHSQI